jgi:hypothetical protein
MPLLPGASVSQSLHGFHRIYDCHQCFLYFTICTYGQRSIRLQYVFGRTIASSEQEAASTLGSIFEPASRCLLSLTQAFAKNPCSYAYPAQFVIIGLYPANPRSGPFDAFRRHGVYVLSTLDRTVPCSRLQRSSRFLRFCCLEHARTRSARLWRHLRIASWIFSTMHAFTKA